MVVVDRQVGHLMCGVALHSGDGPCCVVDVGLAVLWMWNK